MVCADRLSVIPNGLDVARYGSALSTRVEVRRELGLAEDEFAWLAVGNLLPEKDYPTLLEAFARLPAGPRVIPAASSPSEAPGLSAKAFGAVGGTADPTPPPFHRAG